jgi:hypothetical protein
VVVSSTNPELKTLQAAWRWALTQQPLTEGNPEFGRWLLICNDSPYMRACTGALKQEFSLTGPLFGNSANPFANGSKVFITSGVAAGIVILPGGLSPGGQNAFLRAYQIYNSPEFNQLRGGYFSGTSVEVNIANTTIIYEPSLPMEQGYAGMTLFPEMGFVLGPRAFASEEDLARTILHESYRLETSASSGGLSGAMASQETADAAAFANDSYATLIGEPDVPGGLGGEAGEGGGEGGGGAGGE